MPSTPPELVFSEDATAVPLEGSSTSSKRSGRWRKFSVAARKFLKQDSTDNTGDSRETELGMGDARLTPPPSPWAEDILTSYRQQHVQPSERLRWPQTLRWADHGKEELGGKLTQLGTMNAELRRILDVAQHLEDPFLKLRSTTDKPTLWKDTEPLRTELESLHEAVRNINREDGDPCVPLSVKVEDDHNELRAMISTQRTCYTKPREPFLFSLAEGHHQGSYDRIILATPVWDTPSEEIDHLARALIKCKDSAENGSQLIGVATRGTTRHGHFHLQHLESAEHIGGHSAAELVQDSNFREPMRVRLASRVALAFVHFNKIHLYRSHGPLDSYKLFGQKEREMTQPYWQAAALDSVWLDFGFGSSQSSETTIMTKAAFRDLKINPAYELGILLYQIVSGDVSSYELTSSGLDSARQQTAEKLDELSMRCGLYMAMVIRTCLSQSKGDTVKFQEQVLEEVASCLLEHSAGHFA
jgi:hypothetical protein